MESKARSKKYYEANKRVVSLRAKHRRRSNIASTILTDCKRSDRKYGRSCDLDLEFIAAKIASPCVYCGEEELRMTLDRVDNSLGHLRGNVVPACERCNYIRRNMPMVAWEIIAKAVKEARLRGAFGQWVGTVHQRKELPPLPASRMGAPHGTLTRYKTCGPPRCEDCRRAMREWKRSRRKK